MKPPFVKASCCSLICLAIAVLAPAPSNAFATNFSALFMEVNENKESGKSAAAAQAQAQYGGKVLSVSEVGGNGQKMYKVKLLLDSGRIKIVTIKGH